MILEMKALRPSTQSTCRMYYDLPGNWDFKDTRNIELMASAVAQLNPGWVLAGKPKRTKKKIPVHLGN